MASIFAVLLLTAAVAAASVESRVHEYQLKNGLRVIVYVDSSAPVASVNVYYKVGSYDEATGQTGLSHMLEHMTFKRSDIYAPGDFDRILDSVGAVNNGFTSTFYTGYYEDLASDRYDIGLKLEAARMRCIFPDSEFATEHGVVSEERRLQDNRPNSVFWENFEATMFLANPQRNPTIGWSDDVRRFTISRVRDWYLKYYNPANAVLVVAGQVDPADVRARAEKHFGRLKGRPVARTDFYDIEPRQRGQRRLAVRRRVSVPLLAIAFPVPGTRDSNYLVGDVVASVLAGGRNSHLYQRLVVKDKTATSVNAWTWVSLDPGVLIVHAVPKAESLIPAIELAVEDELRNLRTELVTDREMERVRNKLAADEVFSRDDISDMAYFLATSYILHGDWRWFLKEREQLAAVTKEQVREYCRAYLDEDNRTVGTLLSERKEQP
jgi:zinc protease